MSAIMPFERLAGWTLNQPPVVVQKPLPTMYDLPSEDPEEPGLPDTFHHHQPCLLEDTFVPPDYSPDRLFIGTDLNLYYDAKHEGWHKRPDWFVVLGVSHLYKNDDSRRSYVVWDEKVAPFLVVELLSPGTEDEDLGKNVKKPGPTKRDLPPGKWEVYEQILKIPYYAVFSRYTNELQLFKWQQGFYQPLLLPQPRYFFPEIQLGLGLWQGRYHGEERRWLRWYDAAENWIPTPAEKAAQEQQRAEQAEQDVVRERERAAQAEQRAEQLAAKLRALGIDPTQL
jgi:Uma2 family endonuclease